MIDVPELAPHEGSWVIVDRRTGNAVAEVFDRKTIGELAARATEHVEIVMIGTWLARVNARIRSAAR